MSVCYRRPRMAPAAQVEFIQFLDEMKIFGPEELAILLRHSDEWGTEDGMADDNVFVKEIQETVDKYFLDKETVE